MSHPPPPPHKPTSYSKSTLKASSNEARPWEATDDPPPPPPSKKRRRSTMVLGMWSRIEDAALCVAVSVHGSRNWSYISSLVQGRGSKQCRERWMLHLRPGINKKPFSRGEDALLLAWVAIHGTCWAKISLQAFGRGRSDHHLKNRYHVLQGRLHGVRPDRKRGRGAVELGSAEVRQQSGKHAHDAHSLEPVELDAILKDLKHVDKLVVLELETPAVVVATAVIKTSAPVLFAPVTKDRRPLPPPAKTSSSWTAVISGSPTGMRTSSSHLHPFSRINHAMRRGVSDARCDAVDGLPDQFKQTHF
jgi:hypothetical protein